MTTDERLDADLRDVLARRDPGSPPDRLRAAVTAVPFERRSARWSRLRSPLEVAAAVALVAIGVGVMAVGSGQPREGIGGPVATPSPPLGPGTGVVRAMPAIIPFVVIVLAGWATALAARRIASRRSRRIVVVAFAVLAVGYVAVGQADVIGWRDGAYTPGAGDSHLDADGREVVTLDVSPSTPFRMAVTITNTSRFPTVLRGLDEREPPGPSIPRFLGLGMLADPHVFDTATAVAFSPIDLAPGEQVDVVVLVDPGPCVTTAQPNGYAAVIDRLPLVTSTLWWDHVTEVTLPFDAHVPIRGGCTG